MTHKTEIITSRKGGFGGSDAKMFLKSRQERYRITIRNG